MKFDFLHNGRAQRPAVGGSDCSEWLDSNHISPMSWNNPNNMTKGANQFSVGPHLRLQASFLIASLLAERTPRAKRKA
jgi:hypothetical protein